MSISEHNEPRRLWTWLRPWAHRRAEKQKFEAALARLAQADVTDTIAEEDVQLLVAALEAAAREEAAR
jgi:hypothetical protein